METTNQTKDENETGDALIGAAAIEKFLETLGLPEPDAYYLKRSQKLPVGKFGASLIASKRRLRQHVEKLARGLAAI